MTKNDDTIQFIESKGKFGMKLGLDNIKLLLEKLGNPQNKLNFIHVAGSNGKGSICYILESILTESGYKTGNYTSPHLEVFNDRIRINKENIDNNSIERLFKIVKQKCDEIERETGISPTAFEIETAMALLYFLENNTDIAILEVGLGGRLDATNIIPSPLISIISHISLEHTKWLGSTLSEVATEKGGIIKEGTNLIIAPQEQEALDKLLEIANDKKVKTLTINNKNLIKKLEENKNSLTFSYNDEIFNTSLHGNYQLDNLQAALAAVNILKRSGFNFSDEDIRNALVKIKYPGRFEFLKEDPTIILDGAHNIDGITSFVKSFKELFPDKKATVIFGMIKEKDIKACIKEILKITDKFYLLTPDSPDALSANKMKELIESIDNKIPITVLTAYKEVKTLKALKQKESIIVATGSLYLIGKLRKFLLEI